MYINKVDDINFNKFYDIELTNDDRRNLLYKFLDGSVDNLAVDKPLARVRKEYNNLEKARNNGAFHEIRFDDMYRCTTLAFKLYIGANNARQILENTSRARDIGGHRYLFRLNSMHIYCILERLTNVLKYKEDVKRAAEQKKRDNINGEDIKHKENVREAEFNIAIAENGLVELTSLINGFAETLGFANYKQVEEIFRKKKIEEICEICGARG